jgi:hypothetical protein
MRLVASRVVTVPAMNSWNNFDRDDLAAYQVVLGLPLADEFVGGGGEPVDGGSGQH